MICVVPSDASLPAAFFSMLTLLAIVCGPLAFVAWKDSRFGR